MAENQVSVELSIETTDALKVINNTGKTIEGFAKSVEKNVTKAEGSFLSFGQAVGAVFTGGALLKGAEFLIGQLAKIPGALADLTVAGIEANESTRNLGIALAQAGASVRLNEFEKLSESISRLIGIEDEAVNNSVRLALQFGATADQARRIAETAANVAASGLLPFDEAVQQLAGTLNGTAPRAFARSVDGIRGLSEEALRSGQAIDVISKRFEGLAQLNSTQLSVQIRNLGIGFGELQESIGKVIANSPVLRAIFVAINSTLNTLKTAIDENSAGIGRVVQGVIEFGLATANGLAAIVDGVIRFGAAIKNAIEVIVSSLLVVVNALGDAGKAVADFVTSFQIPDNAFDNTKASIAELKSQTQELGEAFDPTKYQTLTNAANTFTDQVIANYTAIQTADNETAAVQATNQNNRQLASEAELQRQREIQAEIAALKDQQAAIDLQRQFNLNNGFFTAEQTLQEQKLALQQAEIDARFAQEERKIALIENARTRELALEKNSLAKKQAFEKAQTAFEAEQQRVRNQNVKDSLGQIATLQQSSSKELFFLGKAAAISTAVIDGIAAVQKALNTPFPLNLVLPGIVGAAAAANVAKIASAKPPAFADGGIVPGSSFSGDRVTARLNSGEMVLNKSQQAELFNVANGRGGAGGGLEEAIDRLGDRISRMNIVVQANAREIARLVRDEREAGFA